MNNVINFIVTQAWKTLFQKKICIHNKFVFLCSSRNLKTIIADLVGFIAYRFLSFLCCFLYSVFIPVEPENDKSFLEKSIISFFYSTLKSILPYSILN